MLKFLKENGKLYVRVVLGITIGLIITISMINADNNNTLAASSVNVDKSNGKLADVEGDTLQATLDYLYEKANTPSVACTATELEIGDYVSITPTLSSFTIPATETGYDSDQQITPNELTL